jgi:hypothetical protein
LVEIYVEGEKGVLGEGRERERGRRRGDKREGEDGRERRGE